MNTDRRLILGAALFAPVIAPLMLATRAEAAEGCFNPDALSSSQKSLRRTLEFQVTAPDLSKSCGGCLFFTKAEGGCGKCQLLNGGPVNASSGCASWARKG